MDVLLGDETLHVDVSDVERMFDHLESIDQTVFLDGLAKRAKERATIRLEAAERAAYVAPFLQHIRDTIDLTVSVTLTEAQTHAVRAILGEAVPMDTQWRLTDVKCAGSTTRVLTLASEDGHWVIQS